MSAQIRRRRTIAMTIVVVGLVISTLLFVTRPRTERQQPVAPSSIVTVHTVSTEQPPIVIRGWGTVQSKQSVSLVPQVAGRVVRVSPHLAAGAFVEAGEVLLEIEDTDYALAVEKARADVAQAEYSLATAREEARVAIEEWELTLADADPDSPLHQIEPTELVFREPQLRQAEASLVAAEASLQQAELNLSRCRLTAPFAGRVVNESADPGDYAMAGSILGRLDAIDIFEITVNLPDRDLAWIRVPQTPGDTTAGSPVTVSGKFGGKEFTWNGHAVRLGGEIDLQSRMMPVVVEVPSPYAVDDGRPPLVAGLFVAVDFASEPPAGTITIPRRGLRPGNLAWILDGDDRLRIREVEVLHADEERVVLIGGLLPGDRLIISNLQYVVEGMPLCVGGDASHDSEEPKFQTAAGGERR
jgi:RND family efflux transporter MFP subunit